MSSSETGNIQSNVIVKSVLLECRVSMFCPIAVKAIFRRINPKSERNMNGLWLFSLSTIAICDATRGLYSCFLC